MNILSRRNYLKTSIGFIGSASLATMLGIKMTDSEPALASKDITPDEALKNLMEGNNRFLNNKRTNPNQDLVRLQQVAKGQNPFAAVLSCADSRVPVEIIFDQGLGDIFVVRDAGNIATPGATGSLEFGTLVLGAKVLMVIGHESCGAIKATMAGQEVPGQIGRIIEQIKPAVEKFSGQQDDLKAVQQATEANVLWQIEQLKKSPVLTDLINQNKLKIVGSYYDLDTGKITILS